MVTRDESEIFVGTIGKPKGLNGLLQVRFFNPQSPLLKKDQTFIVKGSREIHSLIVDQVFFENQNIVIAFQNIHSLDLARGLVNLELWVERSNFAEITAGEFYVADLVGCQIFDHVTQKPLGHVKDIYPTPTNMVMAVLDPTGDEVLWPLFKGMMKRVEVVEKKIWIDPPEFI